MSHTGGRRGRRRGWAALVLLAVAACTPAAVDRGTATDATTLPLQTTSPPGTMPEPGTTAPTAAPVAPSPPIVIGVEYVLIDNPGMISRQADLLREVGFTASKPIAEGFSWGAMQSGPEAPIDFTKLDAYIREFQDAGFTESVLALKSHSTWASVDHRALRSVNAAPQPRYRDAYARWVTAIVERYDGDGIDDMPGLRVPVRHYEIGSEFSSYEPEPVEDYLAMLDIAYEAAHAAYPEVMVSHAAFFVLDLLLGDPPLDGIADEVGGDRYGPHTMGEIRAILDRPDLFDTLNVHALGHPGEIEQLVRWLTWETSRRGYERPIIVSDTSINPFVSFGPAIDCTRPAALMGLTFYPATEEDRCRLADYFTRVLDGDADTMEWLRAYAAADMVKKVVIAAEQGITLINTAFTTDLPILDSKLGQAGAGNAGWGGMIEIATGRRYTSFYAIGQLIGRITGYRGVERVDVGGADGTRAYRFSVGGRDVYVAWYDPPYLVLHGDPPAETTVRLPTGAGTVTIEHMIAASGRTEPEPSLVPSGGAGTEITLDQVPVYVTVDG